MIRKLILKNRKVIVISLALLLYFALLTLISFGRAPAEGKALGESLVKNENFEVEAQESRAWADADGLHFSDSEETTKVFSNVIALRGFQQIMVSFRVNCPEEWDGNATLHVDLCAEGYDTDEQEFTVELTAGENKITRIINKGNNAPDEAQFRIFCLDAVQCDVSDLTVQVFAEVTHEEGMVCAAVVVILLLLLLLAVLKVIVNEEKQKSRSLPCLEEKQIIPVSEKPTRQKREMVWVLILYVLGTGIYFTIQAFPKQFAVYPDEMVYYGIARSLVEQGRFAVHNTESAFTNILYSLLIAPFFLIKDVNTRLIALEVFHCAVMVSAIFPAYLMAKECLQHWKTRVALLLVVVALPDFMLTGTFMSEVVFYPLTLWAVFAAWKLIAEKQIKRSLIYAAIAGVIFFFLYWVKAVSLSILLALSLFLLAQGVLERPSFKRNLLKLFVLFGVFVLVKWVCDNAVFHSIAGSTYGVTRSLDWFMDPYNLLFTIYCVVYNGLAMMLAFFIFPVLVPAINFREMPKGMKEKYSFVSLSVAINFLVISYMISCVENLGGQSIRVHLRYYSPLLVPLLIIFFWHLENPCNFNLKDTAKKYICLVSSSVLLCTLYITVFQGVGFSIVDCALLNFYSHSISIGGKVLEAGAGQIVFNSRILVAKLGICFAIIAGSICLYKVRGSKIKIYVFSALFIMANMINSHSISVLYNQLYRISDERYKEALALGEYIDQTDKKTLVIGSGQQGVLDKYLPSDVDFVDLSYIEAVSDHRTINQMEQYHFIITDRSNFLCVDNLVQEISIDSVENFMVYQNLGSDTLHYYSRNIFPTTVGESCEVPVNDELFYTQCLIQEDGTFVSAPDTSGALVYGPYCKIEAGTYRVDFYYETNALTGEAQIGFIDVNIPELGGVLTSAPVEAECSHASLEFTAGSYATGVEVRFFANVPGVSVQKLEICRLA